MARQENIPQLTDTLSSGAASRRDRLVQIILTAAALVGVLVIEWLRDPFAFF